MQNNLQALSDRFESFAKNEAAGYSPLYVGLAEAIARDPQILELAAQSSKGQPPPNLLFGAVHFLLLRGTDHELALFYPSLTSSARPPEEAYPAFREFCSRHAESIRTVL